MKSGTFKCKQDETQQINITETKVKYTGGKLLYESFSMLDGAAIRLNSSKKGIRFTADLGEFYEENATYHMMIVPKDYLDHFNITGDYYNALLTALTNGGHNTFIATMECLPFQYTAEEVNDSNGTLKADHWYVRGSLTTIYYNNLNTDFFGIAYKIVDGAYVYAGFNEGENVRSLAGVADAALNDKTAEYTDDQKAILQRFVGQAKDQKDGLSEEESNAKYETSAAAETVSVKAEEVADVKTLKTRKFHSLVLSQDKKKKY